MAQKDHQQGTLITQDTQRLSGLRNGTGECLGNGWDRSLGHIGQNHLNTADIEVTQEKQKQNTRCSQLL